MTELPKPDSIFLNAIEYADEEERQAYIQRACGIDQSLREQVQRLVAAHFRGGSILDAPDRYRQGVSLDEADSVDRTGETIGAYKLLQKIGEGGMGVVYLAEQTQPVQRRVALKIIKPGADTQRVIARFEAERQALAMMDHPHIARIFDAGHDDQQRPYFVMELVKGVPLNVYCDTRRLSMRERLELFLPICHALQHAHQKGIIHRDLKPSNILVARYDGAPVPKIIDFGVAKALSQRLTDKTMFTRFGQVIGTLEYMSPEQAEFNQLDIDTRSDIYSLGVVLYELLSGERPFSPHRMQTAALDELLRMIREEEPPLPSQRFRSSDSTPSIAAERSSDPRRLSAMLRGDLDWIVMKALHKERGNRYQTAAQLAEDISRHLAGLPVSACPPSTIYQLRKFVRRRRAACAAAVLVTLALLLGFAATIWQARLTDLARRDAETNAELAEEEARIAQAVRDFLGHLLFMSDPGSQVQQLGAADPNLRVATLLDRATRTAAEQLHEQPRVLAEVRRTLGNAYQGLGRFSDAVSLLREAAGFHEAEFGASDPRTLAVQGELAVGLASAGDAPAAAALQRQLLRRLQEVAPGDAAALGRARNNLAGSLYLMRRYPEAIELQQRALADLTDALGPDHPLRLDAMAGLGAALSLCGAPQQALPYLREVAEGYARLESPNHPRTLLARVNYGVVLFQLQDYQAALETLQEPARCMSETLGPGHPWTCMARTNLGNCLRELGRVEEAIAVHRELLREVQSAAPESADAKVLLEAALGLSRDLAALPDLQGAARTLASAIQTATARSGEDHPQVLEARRDLGGLLRDLGQHEPALELHADVYGRLLASQGELHPDTLFARNEMALDLMFLGRFEEAIVELLPLWKARQRQAGPTSAETLTALFNLAVSYDRAGRLPEALQAHRELLRLESRHLPPDAAELAELRAAVADLQQRVKQAGQAEPPPTPSPQDRPPSPDRQSRE